MLVMKCKATEKLINFCLYSEFGNFKRFLGRRATIQEVRALQFTKGKL